MVLWFVLSGCGGGGGGVSIGCTSARASCPFNCFRRLCVGCLIMYYMYPLLYNTCVDTVAKLLLFCIHRILELAYFCPCTHLRRDHHALYVSYVSQVSYTLHICRCPVKTNSDDSLIGDIRQPVRLGGNATAIDEL